MNAQRPCDGVVYSYFRFCAPAILFGWVFAFPLIRSTKAETIHEYQKLIPSDADLDDFFGCSVSISGDTAVVGAYQADSAEANSGAAYIFTNSGGTWNQTAKLRASDMDGGDFFGLGVSISGNTVIIGAHGNKDAGTNSGSAYIFTNTNGTWKQVAKLLASDAASYDEFGVMVSISGDTAIIGVCQDDDAGNSSGSAYVFTNTGGVWSQTTKLTASDAAAGDRFGWSVSICGDTAIIGTPRNDDSGSNSGSAYIFSKTDGVWSQTAKLTASDATENGWFGRAVSISGNTAIVGACWDDARSDSSAAYIFTNTGGTWSQTAKLVASDAFVLDEFGACVSISGNTAIVGAYRDDDAGDQSGSAYVFRNTGGTWSQVSKLTASDGAQGNWFGVSVSVSGDTAIIGTPYDDVVNRDSGSAYLFTVREPSAWLLSTLGLLGLAVFRAGAGRRGPSLRKIQPSFTGAPVITK